MKITGYQISLFTEIDNVIWHVGIIMNIKHDKKNYSVSALRQYGETADRSIVFPVVNGNILNSDKVIICHANEYFSESVLIYKNSFKNIPKADEFYEVACNIALDILQKKVGVDYTQIKLLDIEEETYICLSEALFNEEFEQDISEFREYLGADELIYDVLSIPQ